MAGIYDNLCAQKAGFGHPPDHIIAHALEICEGHGGKARGLLEDYWAKSDPWGVLWTEKHGSPPITTCTSAVRDVLALDLRKVQVSRDSSERCS